MIRFASMGISLPWFSKNKKNNHFFGLYLTDLFLHGFVYKNGSKGPVVLQSTSLPLDSGFDQISEKVDQLLEILEKEVGETLEETVFFLHSWMIDQETYEIRAPFKDILKKLSKDLQIKPMGYIDVQEGLSVYLEENSTPNIITLELNRTKCAVTIFKGGKKIFSKYFARTDDFSYDLQSVLLQVPRHISLPSTLMIFGSKDADLQKIKNNIEEFDFEKQLFLDELSVETLHIRGLEKIILSLLADQDTQMSEEVDKNEKLAPQNNEIIDTSNSFSEEVFNFAIGHDVAEDEEVKDDFNFSENKISNKKQFILQAGFLQNIFEKLKNIFSKGQGPSQSNMRKPIILGVLFAVIIFVLGLVYEYFFHNLEVKVFLKTEDYTNEFSISLPVSSEPDSSAVAVINTQSQEFSEEKSTTGTREIGEKATGEIVIYNYGKDAITLKEATELKSDSLIFLLNSEVQVSGRSESGERGSSTATATASKIGPEYNLPKNAEFTVSTYTDDVVEIVANKPFTGGSKKEVATVSRADVEALTKNLNDKLSKSSKDVLGASISPDEVLVTESIDSKNVKKIFSSEIGEEAKNLKATVKSETNYVTLKKSLFLNEIVNKIKDELKDGYQIDENNINFEITDSNLESNNLDLEVEIDAKIYKNLEATNMAQDLIFKSPGNVAENLKNKHDFESVNISSSFSHGLWTPIFTKNIKVSFESQ